jgi:flagellar basal body-associated protein FliL
MIFIDIGAIAIMLVLAGAVIAVVRGDKSKAKEAATLRNELSLALYSGDKTKLQNFLVLWNDRLTTEQKDSIKQRIDELYIEGNS